MRPVGGKNFVCVFTQEDRVLLEENGYLLLKSKEGFHIFANDTEPALDFSNIKHTFTSKMTF